MYCSYFIRIKTTAECNEKTGLHNITFVHSLHWRIEATTEYKLPNSKPHQVMFIEKLPFFRPSITSSPYEQEHTHTQTCNEQHFYVFVYCFYEMRFTLNASSLRRIVIEDFFFK